MKSASSHLVCLLFCVSGCATYAPQVQDVARMASDILAHDLDDPSICTALPPQKPAHLCNLAHPDELDLLSAALLFNPELRAAKAAVETARQNAEASKAGPGVTLALSSEYAEESGVSSPWLVGVSVDLPIDAGGRRRERLVQADAAVAQAEIARFETAWKTRMALRSGMIEHFSAAAEGILLRKIATLRARQKEAAERRLAAGEAARTELFDLESRAAVDSTLALDSARRRVAADTAIATAVGVTPDELLSRVLTWDYFAAPGASPHAAGTQDEAEDDAGDLSGRSRILLALIDYDLAESAVRDAVARQFPALSIGAGYTWERGLVKLPAGLGLALPPMDLNRAAIKAAQALRLEAGARLEAAVGATIAAERAARRDHAETVRVLQQIRDVSIPVAITLAEQAERALQAGLLDRIHWADAQIALQQAKLEELQAIANVRRAERQLEDVLQKPLFGPDAAANGDDAPRSEQSPGTNKEGNAP